MHGKLTFGIKHMAEEDNVLCVVDDHFILNKYLLREFQYKTDKTNAVWSPHGLKLLKTPAKEWRNQKSSKLKAYKSPLYHTELEKLV